ncbi:unnamed protein product [Porites lobata]|uniref:E3 ubiquitin-protein ligase n=1 Tax=Porites lobata TaxID=104759 RepID=A0ABN8P9H4_9CNID|nr:unnamed protein product [Porites lobata]
MNDVLGKLIFTKSDPSLTTADGKGLTEGTEDEVCSFKIETRDSQGQITYSGVDKVGVDIRSMDTGNVIAPEITDSKNGCYEVKYKPNIAGKYEVFITVDGDVIVDSPFWLEVKAKTRQKKVQKRKVIGKPVFSSVLSRITWLMVVPENLAEAGFGRCYLVSTRQEILSNIDRNQVSLTEANKLIAYLQSRGGLPYERGGDARPQHPNPGKSYSPLYISAFLPHNSEGKEICDLLQTAFEAGLLFTIGTSPSTGEENKIIWNDIELKTSQSGGPASYGYPDSTYIDRVKAQLAA